MGNDNADRVTAMEEILDSLLLAGQRLSTRRSVQPIASFARRESVLICFRQCYRMTDTTDTPTPIYFTFLLST